MKGIKLKWAVERQVESRLPRKRLPYMERRDIALQRSGCVEKEELNHDEERRERGTTSGRQAVLKIKAEAWRVDRS